MLPVIMSNWKAGLTEVKQIIFVFFYIKTKIILKFCFGNYYFFFPLSFSPFVLICCQSSSQIFIQTPEKYLSPAYTSITFLFRKQANRTHYFRRLKMQKTPKHFVCCLRQIWTQLWMALKMMLETLNLI